MADTFLQRVMEQRDRDQGIGTDADEKRLEVLDARSRLKCSTAGCEHQLTEDAALRFDRCAVCRKKLKGEGGVRRDEVGAAVETTRAIEPTKEDDVTVTYGKGRICTRAGCGRIIADTSKTGTCTPCAQGYAPGSEAAKGQDKRLRKGPGSPVRCKPARVKAKAAPAPPDDIVGLLQSQLDGCDRCARLRRAIEALSG